MTTENAVIGKGRELVHTSVTCLGKESAGYEWNNRSFGKIRGWQLSGFVTHCYHILALVPNFHRCFKMSASLTLLGFFAFLFFISVLQWCAYVCSGWGRTRIWRPSLWLLWLNGLFCLSRRCTKSALVEVDMCRRQSKKQGCASRFQFSSTVCSGVCVIASV